MKPLIAVAGIESTERLYDFQLIYLEAESRFSTKSLALIVTEGDIRSMMAQLLERQHAGEHIINPLDVLKVRVSRKRLVEFILDAVVIDEVK